MTATALSTALNMSYMAEQMALFGIVVGIALLLSGIGFIVLTLGGALRRRELAPVAGFQQDHAASGRSDRLTRVSCPRPRGPRPPSAVSETTPTLSSASSRELFDQASTCAPTADH